MVGGGGGRARPMSVSGIPSPSPTRSNTSHSRRDKYETLPDNRRTSVRPVSANFERKPSVETKSAGPRTIIPPRDSSKRPLQPKLEVSIPNIKELSVPKRLPSKDVMKSTTNGTAPTLRPPKAPSPESHTRQSSKDTMILHTRQSSRDTVILHSRKPSKETTKPTHKIPTRKPSREQSISPHVIRTAHSKEHLLRSQRSHDFSPTSTPTSSPKPRKPSTATVVIPPDAPPEQTRLMQLLLLLPLSQAALQTYETSAHRQLGARYDALQDRFDAIQRQDHAVSLADRVGLLREWSDAHIRSLSNLLVDWESLTVDFRAFCKRLANSLKPINKSVLEERGRCPTSGDTDGRSIVFEVT